MAIAVHPGIWITHLKPLMAVSGKPRETEDPFETANFWQWQSKTKNVHSCLAENFTARSLLIAPCAVVSSAAEAWFWSRNGTADLMMEEFQDLGFRWAEGRLG